MTDTPRRPVHWLAAAGLVSFGLALACAGLAWVGRSPEGVLVSGGSRLAVFGGFLFFDLVSIVAGITLAALRRSAGWSLLPAAAVAVLFAMLFPAFEAFQSVRH